MSYNKKVQVGKDADEYCGAGSESHIFVIINMDNPRNVIG